jgi:hypothetical protein
MGARPPLVEFETPPDRGGGRRGVVGDDRWYFGEVRGPFFQNRRALAHLGRRFARSDSRDLRATWPRSLRSVLAKNHM